MCVKKLEVKNLLSGVPSMEKDSNVSRILASGRFECKDHSHVRFFPYLWDCCGILIKPPVSAVKLYWHPTNRSTWT